MDISPGTRVGDAERQQVADLLARHLGAGRIDLNEFDQRVASVYATTTREDLPQVLADLPELPVRRAPANALVTRSRFPIWQRIEGAAWVGVGALCLLIWGLVSLGAGELTYPWPLWVIGPWGAALIFRAAAGWEARACRGRARVYDRARV